MFARFEFPDIAMIGTPGNSLRKRRTLDHMQRLVVSPQRVQQFKKPGATTMTKIAIVATVSRSESLFGTKVLSARGHLKNRQLNVYKSISAGLAEPWFGESDVCGVRRWPFHYSQC